jgi:hypothetical protein
MNGRFLRGLNLWMARATNSFSCAGLSKNQHGGISGSNHLHLPHDPLHGGGGTDDSLEVVLGLGEIVFEILYLITRPQRAMK